MAKTYLILILTFFLAQTLNSTEIYGVPKIIDGDTIVLNGEKVRFSGIDAPELKQTCIQNDQVVECGIYAKMLLVKKIGNNIQITSKKLYAILVLNFEIDAPWSK